MNVKKLLLATLVVGIVAIIWDYIVHMQILMGTYDQMAIFKKEISILWVIIGDLVWALVFVWVYNRVYSSFGGGAKGGAAYGFYAGILLNFPAMLFNNVIYVDYPYWLAWCSCRCNLQEGGSTSSSVIPCAEVKSGVAPLSWDYPFFFAIAIGDLVEACIFSTDLRLHQEIIVSAIRTVVLLCCVWTFLLYFC
jgi:hypothetical protein